MSDSNTVKLNKVEDFQKYTLQLAQQAQKQIVIFTPDLEPELYDSAAFVEMAMNLIKRSRYTRIRILVQETKHLSERNPRTLKLFRQADEQVEVKKFSADPTIKSPAYFICDDHSIIRRQDTNLYQGFYYANDRARVKDQMEDFDQFWNLASEDSNLRQLTL